MEAYVAEDALSKEQMVRYEELKRVVRRNRPIIYRLQRSQPATTFCTQASSMNKDAGN